MNTAKRLSVILDALLSFNPSPSMSAASAWRKAFDIDEASPTKDDEVVTAVQALKGELTSIEAVLESLGFESHLYRRQFDCIRTAAAPYSLGGTWSQMVSGVVTADVRLALSWAGAVLPDNEDELSADDLQELAKEFDQLSAAIKAANLPPAMQAYAAGQIKTLRAALKLYKVRGIAAIQESVERAFGAAQKAQRSMAAEAAASPEGRTFVERVNGGIARAMAMCDSVEKMHKGGSALLSMAEGLQKLLTIA